MNLNGRKVSAFLWACFRTCFSERSGNLLQTFGVIQANTSDTSSFNYSNMCPVVVLFRGRSDLSIEGNTASWSRVLESFIYSEVEDTHRNHFGHRNDNLKILPFQIVKPPRIHRRGW